jgi:hypothetical protein
VRTQLERDLERRFRERLHTIIGDGLALYQMAELDPKDAGIAMGHELLAAFVKLCLHINDDIPPTRQTTEAIATAITAMFEREKRKMERTER